MDAYIVDDDPRMRRLIARLVEGAGYCVHEFGGAAAFHAALPGLGYGCVLLDIAMPDRCGLDLLAELQGAEPAWPVIMVSGTTEVDHAIAAFRLGAVQFVRKPFRRAEFLGVLAVAAETAAQRLAAAERKHLAQAVRLTPREREVLGGMDRGEQSKLIAWNLGLSCRTIEMHRTNILAKLSARNATHAVAVARNLGLLAA